MHDLASSHPEKVQELKALYDDWARRCGVRPWPLKKPGVRNESPRLPLFERDGQ